MSIVERIDILEKKWENFKIERNSDFEKSIYGQKNKELKDKFKGKRCFILGNGPSIKDEKLEKLKEEIVFVTNDFYLFDRYDDVMPDFYCLFDPYYFDKKNYKVLKSTLKDGIDKLKEKEKKPAFIARKDARYMIEKFYKWNEWTEVYYVDCSLNFYDNYEKDYDISKPVPGLWAVILYAVFIANYMGVKDVYLMGIEQTNIIDSINAYLDLDIERYAFQYNRERQEINKKLVTCHPLEFILKAYVNIFHGYKQVYRYCKKRKTNIYNCTPISLVDCIPKKDFETIFK